MQYPRSLVVAILSVLLYAPLLLLAASKDSAVLNSTGIVTLNGSGVPASTALFQGDAVRTSTGALVSISSPGSSVLLLQNSQLTFKGQSVSLGEGKATITTTRGMAAQSDNFVIAPAAQGTAQYQVERSGGTLLVHAYRGALNINVWERHLSSQKVRQENLITELDRC